jgi:hypothetical protein
MNKGSKTKPAKKRLPKKKTTPKKAEAKFEGQKTTGENKTSVHNRHVRWISQSVDVVALDELAEEGATSSELSGDLQGLSNVECADSESVDELLEEGNAFEAEVVMGVEDAEDADEVEARTHEVPQDDVPAEYLDKSRE